MNASLIQIYIQDDFFTLMIDHNLSATNCSLQFIDYRRETKHKFENPSQNALQSLWRICCHFSVAKDLIANNQLLKLFSKLNSI